MKAISSVLVLFISSIVFSQLPEELSYLKYNYGNSILDNYADKGHLDSIIIHRFQFKSKVSEGLWYEEVMSSLYDEVGFISELSLLCKNEVRGRCRSWKDSEAYEASVDPFNSFLSIQYHMQRASESKDKGFTLAESSAYFEISKLYHKDLSFRDMQYIDKALAIAESSDDEYRKYNLQAFYTYKGFLLRKMGRKFEANEYLNRAIKIDSKSIDGKLAQIFLNGSGTSANYLPYFLNAEMASVDPIISYVIVGYLFEEGLEELALKTCKKTFEIRSRNIKNLLAYKGYGDFESHNDFKAAMGYTYNQLAKGVSPFFPEFLESEEFVELIESYGVIESNYPLDY